MDVRVGFGENSMNPGALVRTTDQNLEVQYGVITDYNPEGFLKWPLGGPGSTGAVILYCYRIKLVNGNVAYLSEEEIEVLA